MAGFACFIFFVKITPVRHELQYDSRRARCMTRQRLQCFADNRIIDWSVLKSIASSRAARWNEVPMETCDLQKCVAHEMSLWLKVGFDRQHFVRAFGHLRNYSCVSQIARKLRREGKALWLLVAI